LGIQQGKREERQEGMLLGIQEGVKKGIEKGIEKGMQAGGRLLLIQQLECKFGKVSELYCKRLKEAYNRMLLKFGKRLLQASRIKEIFDNEYCRNNRASI
jgi:flagellar biosynthesis/type III secretory pathway protein FliH